jgi:hypothetical protein
METDFELACRAANWVTDETETLIQEYHRCKTAHQKNKLIPRMRYMVQKLEFEKRELEKLM